MAWLCDTTELISGAWLSSRYGGHGVRGDAVPSTGTDGPSALYPCLSLPADAAVEVRGYLTRWPTAGTLAIEEDGSFIYTGTADYFEFLLHADGVASSTNIGFGAGIVRVSLAFVTGGAFGAGARLGAVVAAGALSSAASAFTGGSTLAALLAAGTLRGEIGPITRAPQAVRVPSTRAPLGPLKPTTDDAA